MRMDGLADARHEGRGICDPIASPRPCSVNQIGRREVNAHTGHGTGAERFVNDAGRHDARYALHKINHDMVNPAQR